ncbi:MAG: hypothetical protein C4304_08485 [candidate division GAL15 bacterium]
MTGVCGLWWPVWLALGVAVGCAHAAPPAPQPSASPPRALLEVEGTRMVGTDARGRVRWEVRASAVALDRQQRVTARQPVGTLTAEDGTRVQVAAQQLLYRRREGRVELVGQVRVTAGEGRWLTAPYVAYDVSQDLLLAWGGVRLSADGWAVVAERLISEPGLRRVRLAGGVRVSWEAGR